MSKMVLSIFLFVALAMCGAISATGSKNFDGMSGEYVGCSLQQHAEIIKDYVHTAKLCGYSDEQILKSFLNEAEKFEENNGVLTLSLEYDRRTIYWTVGIVSAVSITALAYVIYRYMQQSEKAPEAAPITPPVSHPDPINLIAPVSNPVPHQIPVVSIPARPVLREIANNGIQADELGEDLGFIGREMNQEEDGRADAMREVRPPARRSARMRAPTDFYMHSQM